MKQIFHEKWLCTSEDIMGLNFLSKNQENRWSGFRENSPINQQTN